MKFKVLGPMEVTRSDQALGLGGAKQRALLAILTSWAWSRVPTCTFYSGGFSSRTLAWPQRQAGPRP
jgi:hypothetical protein